jgi:hypothetical protein
MSTPYYHPYAYVPDSNAPQYSNNANPFEAPRALPPANMSALFTQSKSPRYVNESDLMEEENKETSPTLPHPFYSNVPLHSPSAQSDTQNREFIERMQQKKNLVFGSRVSSISKESIVELVTPLVFRMMGFAGIATVLGYVGFVKRIMWSKKTDDVRELAIRTFVLTWIRRFTYTVIVLFVCSYLYNFFFPPYYSLPQNACIDDTHEYRAKTKTPFITQIDRLKFRGYAATEFSKDAQSRASLVHTNAFLLESYMKEHPDLPCAATIDLKTKVNEFPYHVVLRDAKDPTHVHHLIRPILNTTATITIDGVPIIPRWEEDEEYATHCQRLNRTSAFVPMFRQRTQHVLVHFMDLQQRVLHNSYMDRESKCLQHYNDIYTGIWGC